MLSKWVCVYVPVFFVWPDRGKEDNKVWFSIFSIYFSLHVLCTFLFKFKWKWDQRVWVYLLLDGGVFLLHVPLLFGSIHHQLVQLQETELISQAYQTTWSHGFNSKQHTQTFRTHFFEFLFQEIPFLCWVNSKTKDQNDIKSYSFLFMAKYELITPFLMIYLAKWLQKKQVRTVGGLTVIQ